MQKRFFQGRRNIFDKKSISGLKKVLNGVILYGKHQEMLWQLRSNYSTARTVGVLLMSAA